MLVEVGLEFVRLPVDTYCWHEPSQCGKDGQGWQGPCQASQHCEHAHQSMPQGLASAEMKLKKGVTYGKLAKGKGHTSNITANLDKHITPVNKGVCNFLFQDLVIVGLGKAAKVLASV